MLIITPQASEAIRGVLASAEVPDAIMRIAPQPGDPNLAVSIVEAPQPQDQIVTGQDVEICVEPQAAAMLDDKELDASIVEGQVNFSIADQDRGEA